MNMHFQGNLNTANNLLFSGIKSKKNKGPANNAPQFKRSQLRNHKPGDVVEFKNRKGQWQLVVDTKAHGGHRWVSTYGELSKGSHKVKFGALREDFRREYAQAGHQDSEIFDLFLRLADINENHSPGGYTMNQLLSNPYANSINDGYAERNYGSAFREYAQEVVIPLLEAIQEIQVIDALNDVVRFLDTSEELKKLRIGPYDVIGKALIEKKQKLAFYL